MQLLSGGDEARPGSPLTTRWKLSSKLLISGCLSTIPGVCFPSWWLLPLETARRADPR